MPISSIDFTTMAPRSVEAAPMVGREMQMQQHIADQGASNMQQKVDKETQQTVESQESETKKYDVKDKDGENSSNSRNKKKKEEEQENKEKEAPMAPRSDSRFDIMI